MSSQGRLNAKHAIAGDIEALVELADGDEGDAEAYKWLQVALDFGHQEAAAHLEKLEEGDWLGDDDEQIIAGTAHLELGMAYLTGSEGLPRDLKRAAKHLEEAVECGYPDSVPGGDEILRDLRENLTAEALETFETVYPK